MTDSVIDEELREVLDRIDECLARLREKITLLSAAKGLDDDDD